MEQNSPMTLWQRHKSYIINVLGFLGFFVLFSFWIPVIFWVFWHYVVCILFILASYLCKKEGKQGLVVGITILVCIVAVAGFFLVYQTMGHIYYSRENWSFYRYVTRHPALPIFLLPCIAVGIAVWKPKHNSGRTDPGQSRTQT